MICIKMIRRTIRNRTVFVSTDTRRTWRLCSSFIPQTSSESSGTFSSLWSGENPSDSLDLNPSSVTLKLLVFLHSHKFGKKLTYVNYLAELREHLNYEQLIVPPDVLRYWPLTSDLWPHPVLVFRYYSSNVMIIISVAAYRCSIIIVTQLSRGVVSHSDHVEIRDDNLSLSF